MGIIERLQNFLRLTMPRIAKTSFKKILVVLNKYPTEFQRIPNNQLFCSFCDVLVRFEKSHFIELHRRTKKHQDKLLAPSSSQQSFLPVQTANFATDWGLLFLANIPFHKLRHPMIKSILQSTGRSIPCEST